MHYLAQKIPVAVLLAISSTGVILGDLFAKTWSVNQRSGFLVLAIVGYCTSMLFYIPTLLTEGLIVTSIVWSLVSTVGLLVIGLVLFREHLNATQTVATVLGVVSLVLFAFAGK